MTNLISKIIVTGDILRPTNNKPGNQNKNIKWFYYLFKNYISHTVPHIPIQLILPTDHNKTFDIEHFYKLNHLGISNNSWAQIYDSPEITNNAKEYFLKHFLNSLVIGYELPPVFLNIMNEYNIPYIDFLLHPCRFMDDVFFGIHSNNYRINTKLKSNSIPEIDFYAYASFHKAGLSRLPALNLEPESALIVGQTDIDRSLIQNGNILDLKNYESTLDAINKQYSKIYFKPHPYANNTKSQIKFLDQFNTEIITDNVYRIICDENINQIFSISSSVIEESRFFKVKSTQFKSNSHSHYIPVFNKYFNSDFWYDILSCLFDVKSNYDFTLPEQNSRLRDSLGLYWGYHLFGMEKANHDINKDDKLKINNLYRIAKNTGLLASYNFVDSTILFLKRLYKSSKL